MWVKPFHCTKATAFFGAVGMLVLSVVCLVVDAVVPGRVSSIVILAPCAISLTFLFLMRIADLQTEVADLKRELEGLKGKN